MPKKAMTSPEARSSDSDIEASAAAKSPELVNLLAKAASLLQENKVKEAMTLVARGKIESPWVTNALGVCQLRLGDSRAAVGMFRGLVLGSGGLSLRNDVPTVFKTNYAAALFAAENIAGGISILDEIRDETHPAVQRLRAAVGRWKNALSFWQRINWYLGSQPAVPLVLDIPAGDL